MELKEAIKILNDFKNTGYHMIMIKNNWDQITTNRKIETAIDTVLKELDNRIPISKVEKILETTKQLREKEIKELGMSLRGSAVDILENILKNYKE